MGYGFGMLKVYVPAKRETITNMAMIVAINEIHKVNYKSLVVFEQLNYLYTPIARKTSRDASSFIL